MVPEDSTIKIPFGILILLVIQPHASGPGEVEGGYHNDR